MAGYKRSGLKKKSSRSKQKSSYRKGLQPRSQSAGGRAPRGAKFARTALAHRVAGRSGSMQIPHGFVGMAADAKFIEITTATYPLANDLLQGTGVPGDALVYLSLIPQGTTVNSRVGKACKAVSLNIRGAIKSNTTAAIASYHVYLIWDYQPNKALPAITDVLKTQDNNSFNNRTWSARFKFLRKYAGVTIGNSGAPATGQEAYYIDDTVAMPADAYIQYTTGDTTGTIGACTNGALYLLGISDQVSAGTVKPELTAIMRLNFEDM